MKKATLSILFALLLLHIVPVNAGKTKGKVTTLEPKAPVITFSLNGNGGTSSSSGVSNAINFNPNASLEIAWGNFGLGLDAGTFSTKPDFDFTAYSAPLKGLDFLTVKGANTNWTSTSVTFGPSYTIPLNSVKPISGIGIVVKHNRAAELTIGLKAGITFNATPDFSVISNSTQRPFASYSPSSDYKKNALTIKPSVVFRYWFSENVAVNANVQYAMQTGQTAFTTGYKDLTNVSLAPPLSPDQFNKNISTAPTISTTTVGPDKYLSFGVGLTYSFGKKGWDGSIKGNRKGIRENGLKKNETDNPGSTTGKKGLNAVNVKLSKSDSGTEGTSQRKGWDGSIKGNVQSEKHYITIPHNLKNLKVNENGVSEITTHYAVGKHYITISHDLQNRKDNTESESSTNTSERKSNPNDNTGGPSNQVFGYEEAASLELCVQFLDNQGSECEYGSGTCFINIILCEEDAGAITYTGGSHVYFPTLSEKLNELPISVLLYTNTKNETSLKGKEFNLKTDVELSPEVARSLNCEKASLKAGKYKYNQYNAVELPIKMVGRKGWDGSIKGNKN